MNKVDISIIVPIYNEEENIALLHQSISDAAAALNKPYEIIYVDDGSTDRTICQLKIIAENDSHATVVQFRKNYGQTAAMTAGFDYAKGDIVVSLDGDLQNDPKDIAKLLAVLDEGHDVVSGWRKDRKDNFLLRRLPSIVANKLISWVTGVSLHDYGCTLKAYRREILQDVNLYGEMHRFIPVYTHLSGARVAEVEVGHNPRLRGKSKYGLSRIIKVFLDMLVVKFLASYATKPIYLFGGTGLVSLVLGLFVGVTVIGMRLFFDIHMNRSPLLLLSVMLIIIGIQFMLMGLLAEINIRTYYESQEKSIYSVRHIYCQETYGLSEIQHAKTGYIVGARTSSREL